MDKVLGTSPGYGLIVAPPQSHSWKNSTYSLPKKPSPLSDYLDKSLMQCMTLSVHFGEAAGSTSADV